MHLYFMFTAVSYQMFFHWCSFMYPHWGFWNKPFDLTWLDLVTYWLTLKRLSSVPMARGLPGVTPLTNVPQFGLRVWNSTSATLCNSVGTPWLFHLLPWLFHLLAAKSPCVCVCVCVCACVRACVCVERSLTLWGLWQVWSVTSCVSAWLLPVPLLCWR